MEPIGYGITRLALVPVRKEPSHRSEQVTQLLFGEHYEILKDSTDGKWLYINICADRYKGWIDSNQHSRITVDHFNEVNHTEYKITTDLTSSLLYKKRSLTILIGSILPISSSEIFNMEEQFAFNGESKNLGQKKDFDFLKGIAMQYLNAPYTWGGRSPLGIDCSGFIQLVFKISGYKLPRDAYQQARAGKAIDEAAAKPGDLAFFSDREGKISHVGLILEGNNIIHASGKVQIDRYTSDGIVNAETGVLTHTLARVCSIIPDVR